ncbi:MAG: aldo/keto reductase [Steroidobacteraceae bacterium]|nr:aldo/keto reductase [Steroidobacteraceae bacterium]
MTSPSIDRRLAVQMVAAAITAALAPSGITAAEAPRMLTRKVPGSGEDIPVIGMGSSDTFDVGNDRMKRAVLQGVLRGLVEADGRVIDTSPMYGSAESVLGDLIDELGLGPKLWFATKVWTRGREAGARQIEASFARLRTKRLDLLQIHNLLDWREHVPTLRALQASGKVRYSGITHYRADAHAELERVLGEEQFDWLQVNYSLAEREAEDRLLPYCRDRGIAVMVNRPFADGAVFARLRGRPLPGWAEEIGCRSWGQFFLRYVISHPAVTCVIPATSKPQHMADNAAAGQAPLPDSEQRRRMAEFWQAL